MEINETEVRFSLEELGLTPEQAKSQKYLLKAILEHFYQNFPQDRGQNLSIKGGGRAQLLSFPKESTKWKITFDYIMTPDEDKQLPSLPTRMYGVNGIIAAKNAERLAANSTPQNPPIEADGEVS